jgi:hypothetical protein
MEAPSWSSAHRLDAVLVKPSLEPRVWVQGNVASNNLPEVLPAWPQRSKNLAGALSDSIKNHWADTLCCFQYCPSEQ